MSETPIELARRFLAGEFVTTEDMCKISSQLLALSSENKYAWWSVVCVDLAIGPERNAILDRADKRLREGDGALSADETESLARALIDAEAKLQTARRDALRDAAEHCAMWAANNREAFREQSLAVECIEAWLRARAEEEL